MNSAISDANGGGTQTAYVTTSFDAVNPIALNAFLPIFLQGYTLGVQGLGGAGGLVVTSGGSGTLKLTGINTFSGGLSFNTSTVMIDGDTALGASTGVLTLGSATLKLLNDVTSTRQIQLSALGATIDTGAFNITQSGIISGTAGLFKVGAGTMTLTGINTYTGGTSVNEGVLVANATGALGAGNITLSGGTLDLQNGFGAQSRDI